MMLFFCPSWVVTRTTGPGSIRVKALLSFNFRMRASGDVPLADGQTKLPPAPRSRVGPPEERGEKERSKCPLLVFALRNAEALTKNTSEVRHHIGDNKPETVLFQLERAARLTPSPHRVLLPAKP